MGKNVIVRSNLTALLEPGEVLQLSLHMIKALTYRCDDVV